MKRFIKTEFFFMVKNASLAGFEAHVLEREYDSFASLLFSENTAMCDKKLLFNALCYAQVEFKSLLSKKKCPIGLRVYQKSAFTY